MAKSAARRKGGGSVKEQSGRKASTGPKTRVQEIRLQDIDLDDRTYEFRVMPRVEKLKKSLEAEGQQFPVVLRGTEAPSQIVCGFRRIRALQELGARTVKATIRTDLTDEDAFKLSFLENEQRRNLDDLDRANIVGKLQSQGKTQEEIAGILGRSRRQIARYAKILSFPARIKNALAEKRISAAHALILNAALEKVDDLDLGLLIQQIQDQDLSALDLSKRLRALAKEKRAAKPERLFKKRGDGFSMRALSYNPKTATEKEKEQILHALERALETVRGGGGA